MKKNLLFHSFVNILYLLIIGGVNFIPKFITAQTDRGYYTAPYVRYEAEDGVKSSNAILHSSPQVTASETAAEASGRKYIGLAQTGDFVKFKVNKVADGITLRFNMPDSSNQKGKNGRLSFYVNGVKVSTQNLSSYWAYQYFYYYNPSNKPSSSPHMRFDEIHFKLATKLQVGDTLKIQKDTSDAIEYGIDFIEIEEVPAKIENPDPANYYSVTDYGAIPNDNLDDIDAFFNCIQDAAANGKNVYIPEGKFDLSWIYNIVDKNIKITGAGIWYTELYFSTNDVQAGGFSASDAVTNIDISNFYMSTINNERLVNGVANNYKNYHGFTGTYGNNSKIHNIWLEHFETGFWIADNATPIVATNGLDISECRIRNTYADGVNFSQGTSNSIVEYSNIRNCGDDGLAVWPSSTNGAVMATNNIFRYCTVDHIWRASGIAIFGGEGHQINNCLVSNGYQSAGMRFTTDFTGYPFSTNSTNPILCNNNTIINCGTNLDLWNTQRGAIDFNASSSTQGYNVCYIQFRETKIIDSQKNGVQFFGNGGKYNNITFYNTTIDGTGTTGSTPAYGILANTPATQAEFDYVVFANTVSGDYLNQNTNFKLIINFPGQLGIGSVSKKDPINVYYNSMMDVLEVKGETIHLISIYDLSGRQLIVKENTSRVQEFSVGASGLKNGIYLIQLETEKHEIISGKIIKF